MADNAYRVTVAVTPTNNTAAYFASPLRAFYVGKTGNIKIRTRGMNGANSDVILTSVQAGRIYNIETLLVFSANTTVTNIVGLY